MLAKSHADDVVTGAILAEALDNGRAASVLDNLRRLSTESPVATATPDQTGTATQ